MWKYTGINRPHFADEPQEGQESVWDYPRPPALVRDTRYIEVRYQDIMIAASSGAYRILETASPPTVYIPPKDVSMEFLQGMRGSSFCEWKGAASYWGLADHVEMGAIGWSYRNPSQPFRVIKDFMSFYPALVECYIDGERVRPQPGGFYGGWVTKEIVGPYKGESGTGGW